MGNEVFDTAELEAANATIRELRNASAPYEIVTIPAPNGTVTIKCVVPTYKYWFLSQARINNVAAWTRKLIDFAPPMGNVEIMIGEPTGDFLGTSDGVTANLGISGWAQEDFYDSVTNPNRFVILSPKAFRPEMAARYHTNRYMSTAYQTPNDIYTLVHEWGHVVDTLTKEEHFNLFNLMYNSIAGMLMQLDLSTYGYTSQAEAFAEAFAEWFLTNGETKNGTVLWFAKQFNWKLATNQQAMQQA